MEGDEPEIDLAELYEKHPREINGIIVSILFTSIILPTPLKFMWYEGTSCGVWGNDYSCTGSVWLTLAYVAILCVVMAPGIWGGVSMFAKNFTYVNDQQRGEVALLAAFGLPFAAIWATIWLYCLPTTWTLLPWGSWETNWWKIFPYIFGLSWFGLGPLFATIRGIGGKFKEFAEAEKRTHEFQEDFKNKLAASSDETMKFQFPDGGHTLNERKDFAVKSNRVITDQADAESASTESYQPQFTSILGDMDIHEKYK